MNDIIAMLREARHARVNEIERIDAAIELLDTTDTPDDDDVDESDEDEEQAEPDEPDDDYQPDGYPCPIEGCDFVAKTGPGLGPHARTHRRTAPEPAATAVEAPPPELSAVETVTINRQCSQCGSLFPNRRHLELHGRKFGHDIDEKP